MARGKGQSSAEVMLLTLDWPSPDAAPGEPVTDLMQAAWLRVRGRDQRRAAPVGPQASRPAPAPPEARWSNWRLALVPPARRDAVGDLGALRLQDLV